MPCDEILIEAVDVALHSKLLAQATAAGVSFTGNVAKIHGISLQWDWDETSANLRITALSYPWYVSCSAIASEIQKIVARARQGGV